MEIIAFDISGKMGHFRKYYANNTAFSYSLPPRTTIMGILAALLGLERNSYHERFATDKLRIGVRILKPVKKTFHRLNFLRIESTGDTDMIKSRLGDFTGEGNRKKGAIQTPFEIVTGLDLREDYVTYRIYLSYMEAGKACFDAIKKRVQSKRGHYNISLGTANFSAQIGELFEYQAVTVKPTTEFLNIYTTVPVDAILTLNHEQLPELNLEEELLPLEFVADKSRELKAIQRVLFSTNGLPIQVQFRASCKCAIFKIMESEKPIHLLFLEPFKSSPN